MDSARLHRTMVVTNAYPAPDAPYRNMFIHTRVRHYQRRGLQVVVFVIDHSLTELSERTFDGVTIYSGKPQHAAVELSTRQPQSVLMHFVSFVSFQALRPALSKTRVIIWLHGYEAEAWHRRWYSALASSRELRNFLSRKSSFFAPQRELFRDLTAAEDLNLHFVTVSELFFKRILAVDAGIPPEKCTVIHNPVDTDLFRYRAKAPQDRLRILTIRPFASAVYANDLVVRTILHLRDSPVFDRLHFTVVGEGPLFAGLVEPLRALDNVDLIEGMLQPPQIVGQHAAHGVFLAPGRADSQGVSRCEAMASGLVPVASDVAAVPEFVEDGVTGLLAPPEDWKGLAERIERLVEDPELFLRLSAAAAERMRQQCGPSQTIDREVDLILHGPSETIERTGRAPGRTETLETALRDMDADFGRALQAVSDILETGEGHKASLEERMESLQERIAVLEDQLRVATGQAH